MIILFALFAGLFPRLGTLFIWLARPAMFNAAFGGSWLLPILGIFFLPFTTLMYVIVWSSTGLTTGDWFWVILALLIDISAYANSGYASMNKKDGSKPAAQSA